MINDLNEVQWAYLLDPTFQIENTAGKPLTGGYIEVYLHGTRTKYYCAKDFDGTLHEFKIPLDSLGANIVLASPAHAYDVYVYNRFGSLVMSRYNVVPATGDGTVIIKNEIAITSEDDSIKVTESRDVETNIKKYDLSVNTEKIAKDVEIIGTDGSVKVDRTELPNGVQYDLSVNTDIIKGGNCIGVSRTDNNNVTISFDVTAGISDIELVNSLPAQPLSTVLYLIPEVS